MSQKGSAGAVGFVYIIHFERPLKHARNYIGFALDDVAARFESHKAGRGARILEVLNDLGIDYKVVAIFRGTRDDERAMKRGANSYRYCPACCADRGKVPMVPRFHKRNSGEGA